mmetsp:Transcript_13824/g.20697  ORF Transcript_13824/g.20697 Transcript_13824/m.20697 type:complete len:462 (+) Transcript_13824:44-1429(+)
MLFLIFVLFIKQERIMAMMNHKAGLELAARIQSSGLVLAPLTRGGTPPFRSLTVTHGADITMGEMIFSKYLLKGDGKERARLRRHESEPLFGAQIATNAIDEGIAATKIAAEAGVDWIDLNCGCPIYEATRRGLGSALLRKPEKLARLVNGLVQGSPIPISVKIRMSPSGDGEINYQELLLALAELGDNQPAFVTLHGRTANARYRFPANWEAIHAASKIFPRLIGNGDCLTFYEYLNRTNTAPSTLAVMIGRGALINPWIFDEIKNQQTWLPSAEERIEVYYDLATRFKQHFGDDQRGRSGTMYFFPFHFDFFSRWRPLSAGNNDSPFFQLAANKPLIQSGREIDDILETHYEGPRQSLPPLERLLRIPVKSMHESIALALFDANSVQEAIHNLDRLATPDTLNALEIEAKNSFDSSSSRDETEGHSSSSSSSNKKKKKNRITTTLQDVDAEKISAALSS